MLDSGEIRMPRVLTTNALIVCPHGGKGTSIPNHPRWLVDGGFVLVENDTGILSCTFIPPCIGYTLTSMELNATQIDGQKVILETDFNKSFTGLPLRIQDFHKTIDNSTPAPIPAGQSAPPLPAALADLAKPVVTAIPPELTFDTLSTTPPGSTITFTLASDHPLQWILTLINESPVPSHLDVTNGIPPGLVVAPSGGSWKTPVLTVTMTMTSAYMASLGPGRHHFYMTAVSKRGLSNYIDFVLTVN
jgi:hypothetical protein